MFPFSNYNIFLAIPLKVFLIYLATAPIWITEVWNKAERKS